MSLIGDAVLRWGLYAIAFFLAGGAIAVLYSTGKPRITLTPRLSAFVAATQSAMVIVLILAAARLT